MDEPKGRKRKVTDAELRDDLAAGLTQAQIAAKYGVSPAAINQRVKRMETSTAAAVVAPEESRRFVRSNIDVMEELARSLRRVNLLSDACDAWLRDAKDPDRYDLSPRSHEVMITYEVELARDDGTPYYQKRKKSFSELCACLMDGDSGEAGVRDEDAARFVGVKKGETKVADTRDLILKTASEVRQTVNTLTDLGQLLVNIQSMERYREKFLEIIGTVSPEVRNALVEALRRDLLLNPAFGGPSTLPAG